MTSSHPHEDSHFDGAQTKQSAASYQAAALDYRTRLGWMVYALGTIVWLTPGTPIEAFNVPREIGERTLAHLRARGVHLPVINIPGPPDRWALLTKSHDGPGGEILDLFARHGIGQDIGYAYLGHHSGRTADWSVDLPPTRHPRHEPLSWITSADTPLPAALAVAYALTEILTGEANE